MVYEVHHNDLTQAQAAEAAVLDFNATWCNPCRMLAPVLEEASNDLEGVLDQLSRMGYEGVEFAGFFEKTAKEVRKLLKHTGLKAVSSHVPLQQIRDDMQSVLDYHEELECGCIAVECSM